MSATQPPQQTTSSDTGSKNDPRAEDPRQAERHDPHAGVSDDPRVDPTPDRRHSAS